MEAILPEPFNLYSFTLARPMDNPQDNPQDNPKESLQDNPQDKLMSPAFHLSLHVESSPKYRYYSTLQCCRTVKRVLYAEAELLETM